MSEAALERWDQVEVQRMVDDLPVPLMVYDATGTLRAMNSCAERLWVVQRQQIIGHFNILEDAQSVAQGSREIFARALAGEQFFTAPALYDTTATIIEVTEGRQVWIQAQFFPLRHSQVQHYGVGVLYQDITQQMGQQQVIVTARDEIASQRQAIESLSTPVIEVWDGILTLPLIGLIDTQRAQSITERLLEAIVRHRANVVILDITGVPIVDTNVASYLMSAAQAVRLLGSQVALVGVSSEVAQTMVQLGVDISQITTLANLKAGIAWAFKRQGLCVVEAARQAVQTLAPKHVR